MTSYFSTQNLIPGDLQMDKLDTVECMTDRYFERGGRTLIGIYYLPQTVQHNRFTVFLRMLFSFVPQQPRRTVLSVKKNRLRPIF